MVDDHLIFLVTIPIHYGSNESSERSSERTIKSSGTGSGTGSGTHPHKVLGQAKRQRRAWEHPYNRVQAKNIQELDLSVIFARKLQKSHLKMG